jgi:hypothetical protein
VRIVGKKMIGDSVEDRWNAGLRACDLVTSLGVPDFSEKGVFRGTQQMFDRMDEERDMRRRRWLDEHTS